MFLSERGSLLTKEHFFWDTLYFDNTIDNYDKFMLVYKSLKHRASLQSTTFYVISENFSFLHYKLFENIQIFESFELFEYILQHE